VTLPAAAAIDGGADATSFDRLAALCLRASRSISLASAIPMAFLGAFSLPICRAWLGDRPDLALLPLVMTLTAVAAHLNIITGPASATFRSQGNVANEFVYHGLRIAAIAAGVGAATLLWGVIVPALAWGVSGGIAIAAVTYLAFALRLLGIPLRQVLTRVLLPGLVPMAIAVGLALAWEAWVPATMTRWPALALLAVFGLAHLTISSLAVWQMLEADERSNLRPLLRRLKRSPVQEQ
jgi:hypothetical protein